MHFMFTQNKEDIPEFEIDMSFRFFGFVIHWRISYIFTQPISDYSILLSFMTPH